MRLAEIAIAAVIGGAIGFAASHYVANQAEAPAPVDPTAAIDARLAELGIASKADIDGRISGGVAQFLADQPEAVVGALEKYQENQQRLAEEERQKTLASLQDALTTDAGDPAIGASAEDAEVTLVEFFDYRCGYCRRALGAVAELAATDPTLRIVMKEFPILGKDSVSASIVSLAANLVDPTKYWALHEALMAHQGAYDQATLLGIAAEAGYDPDAITAAMSNPAIGTQIQKARDVADALGVRGTPAFIVGERIIPGAVPVPQLRAAIEEARAAAKDKG